MNAILCVNINGEYVIPNIYTPLYTKRGKPFKKQPAREEGALVKSEVIGDVEYKTRMYSYSNDFCDLELHVLQEGKMIRFPIGELFTYFSYEDVANAIENRHCIISSDLSILRQPQINIVFNGKSYTFSRDIDNEIENILIDIRVNLQQRISEDKYNNLLF